MEELAEVSPTSDSQAEGPEEPIVVLVLQLQVHQKQFQILVLFRLMDCWEPFGRVSTVQLQYWRWPKRPPYQSEVLLQILLLWDRLWHRHAPLPEVQQRQKVKDVLHLDLQFGPQCQHPVLHLQFGPQCQHPVLHLQFGPHLDQHPVLPVLHLQFGPHLQHPVLPVLLLLHLDL